MYGRKKYTLIVCLLSLALYLSNLPSTTLAQNQTSDEKIIERYKLMLSRTPKEGSTFDRLYQLYLESAGLDAMVTDYEAEVAAQPNDPNLQLILGHIHKRLGKDTETLAAYQRAVELAPNAYYPHFALGQMFATLRRHEDAINELTKAATLSEQTQAASPEELMAIYKALGRAYFSRDRVDEAISAWKKISELDPENIYARIELADLFREQGLYDQAIAEHEAIIQLKIDDPYRVCLSHREIGNIHEANSEYDNAIKNYNAALALTAPGNWLRKDLQHRIIGIYAADGNWEGLITHYQDKLETTPNDPELIGLLASAYIENQQADDGIAAYQKAVELAPTDTGLRLNLIAALRNAEKFEDAAAAYEVLTEQQPDDFGIYRELGELYLQLEDENKAKTTYQRIVDRNPEDAATYLTLAEIYAGNQWIDDAAAAYQKAIALAPDNLDYIEYFGEFYFRHGNREKTLETWNQLVTGDNNTAENYDRLAQLLDAKDFRTEAIAAGRKAVELAPDAYRYREALAHRLTENKDYNAALTEYIEAEKLAPNDFFAEQMADEQIEIYRQQGTLVAKIEALEAALETTETPEADVFSQYKQLAKMYLKLGNITYTLEVLLKAKTLQPNNVLINRWLAETYAQQGLRTEANVIYTHLTEIDSANAREYFANIARAHLNVMDFDAATDAAKKAVAHSPRNPEGHQMLAQIAKQIADYQTAIDSFKQAIRMRPEATDIRSELAAVYKLSGNPRQAIEQYWRCWDLSESINDKLTFIQPLSETYNELGRSAELKEKLKQLSKTDTANVGTIVGLAELYHTEGDLSRARFQLARALDKDRENPTLLAQLVKISLDLGDTQEALTYQERLAKTEPDPSHQQRLGELLFDTGREQEAIQAWTKLLHAKNQLLEADIKLAGLLIQHGLLDEAISVLDRTAEKVTGPNAHLALYQLGATLTKMNEFERATSHFQRILDMSTPAENDQPPATVSSRNSTSGPPGINMHRFNLPQDLIWNIQGQPFGHGSGQQWIPGNFEEAQAGALVQLTTIAQQQHKLSELIAQLEAEVTANPKNIQILERLAQIYTLTGNPDKTTETIDRLLAASPNDVVYQSLRLSRAIEQNLDYETLEKYLNEMTGLTPEARLWYIGLYARNFYRQGRKVDAEKLVAELEKVKITDLNTSAMLVDALAQSGQMEAAAKIIEHLPVPSVSTTPRTLTTRHASQQQRQWNQYQSIYQNLVSAYIREKQIEKGIALFRTFFERTQPPLTHARHVATLVSAPQTFSGYTPLQSNYPSPTIYYNQNRLTYLQQTFGQLWTINHQAALYTKLQTELDAAEGRNRIYPGLALSYCYWWEGQREKAQTILSLLQKELPDDLTLKLNTVFASIQIGQHALALNLLKELAERDARNRRQYYNLTLQLAAHTGDTVTIRELMTKVLNSPIGARELYQFSQKLQESGLTQYAIATAKKATALAMAQRDPNFLIDLSQHLEALGRGQDAARIAERALRSATQRDRYGRTLHAWHFQNASRLVGTSKVIREREPELVTAAEKNPDSFQAHAKLATFYESTNQQKKATEAFETALSLRPKDSLTRQRYAQMLQRSGQAKAAVIQYSMLLKDNPNALGYNFWEVIETFFQADAVDELVALAKDMIAPAVGRNFGNDFARSLARQCMENNNATAAIELYEKIIAVHPNRYHQYKDLAAAYAAAGQPEKAILFLREKLETGDTKLTQDSYEQLQVVPKLIELYTGLDRIDELAAEYEAKLAEKPEDPALTYLVASMKIAANDLEGAERLVNQLFNDNTAPMNTQWLIDLADAYRRANDRERELRLLESAVTKINPQNIWGLAEVYQKLGTAYMQKNEKEKAQDALRKMGAIRLSRSGSSHEREMTANTYMQHEMWDDAEALFTGIINDFSTQRWTRQQAQQQLMTIKRQRDDLTTTPQTAEKAQNFNVGTQRALAQQHARQGEVKKAVEIYEQIEKVMPEDLESRAQLATLYTRQNKHEKAIDVWKTLTYIDPENTKYQDGLVDTYQDADKTDEAFELAQQYIEKDPESGVHYIRLAKLYAAEDRVDDAINIYKKAIELGHTDGKAYLQLAQLYLRKDNLTAAEKAFEDAIQHTGQEWERANIEKQLMALYRRQGKLETMLKAAEDAGTLTFEMQQQRARDYRNAGELEKAIDAYKKAIDLTAQRWERERVSNELLALYARIGEDDLAMELYEKLSQSASRGMSITQGTFGVQITLAGDAPRENLIKAYKNQGKLDELQTIFEAKIQEGAITPAILEMVADIYRNADNHAKTAAAYQALCKAQPGNIRSFYYAAAAFQKNNQPDLAKEMQKQGELAFSTSNRRQDIWFLMALASICAESGMYDAAITFGEDTIAASSQFAGFSAPMEHLYESLGKSYLGAQRYEEAVKAYQQMANASRYDEIRKRAETAIHRAYKEGNLYEKQIPEQLQKIKETPDDPDAHLALAKTYEFSDKVDEALAAYEKISELQPDNAEWYKKIGDLTQKSQQTDTTTRLAKASTAYEKAIELEPTAYESYNLLAQTYLKREMLSEAESVYRRALDAALELHDHNTALRALWKLYADANQQNRGIAALEELKPTFDKRGQKNALFLELLGDAYKEVDDSQKADAVYAEWFALREKEVNRKQQEWDYRSLADQLLEKDLMPETALELAERAASMRSTWDFTAILGRAYVANDKYEKALAQFKLSLNGIGDNRMIVIGHGVDIPSQVWSRIAQAGKNAKDEERYIEMVDNLMHATPENPMTKLHATLTLARFYHERDKWTEAEAYMDKTAFIPENTWWTVGPFDNGGGIGYNRAYISEDTTQLDTDTEYDGIDGQVGWKKQADGVLDGFVNFQKIFDKNINWNTAYAWTTVNAPDERKAELRFGSGSQAKLWLNGETVFTHSDTHTVGIDQDTIPVTLKQGENTVLVKVCNEDNYSLGFYLRITDTDGEPFLDLKFGKSEDN